MQKTKMLFAVQKTETEEVVQFLNVAQMNFYSCSSICQCRRNEGIYCYRGSVANSRPHRCSTHREEAEIHHRSVCEIVCQQALSPLLQHDVEGLPAQPTVIDRLQAKPKPIATVPPRTSTGQKQQLAASSATGPTSTAGIESSMKML